VTIAPNLPLPLHAGCPSRLHRSPAGMHRLSNTRPEKWTFSLARQGKPQVSGAANLGKMDLERKIEEEGDSSF
jgi:hypothetical protein